MARPLRVNAAGGWYHLTARGKMSIARETVGRRSLRAEANWLDVVGAVERITGGSGRRFATGPGIWGVTWLRGCRRYLNPEK
jgi:hypothetical protein